eukprot:Sdes_comp20927_c1_seq1m18354
MLLFRLCPIHSFCSKPYASHLLSPIFARHLFSHAYKVLIDKSPAEKCRLVFSLSSRVKQGETFQSSRHLPCQKCPDFPVVPSLPELISIEEMPSPKQMKVPLSVYLLHSLLHIEFNAINMYM